MKPKRTVLNDAQRCLMCYQPVCNQVCPDGVKPARIVQALHLDNEHGARLESAALSPCLTCEDARCEKACIRKNIDHAVQIRDICNAIVSIIPLSDNTPSSADAGPADLSTDFCGIRCENPFFLASSPVASSYDMCCRAFDAGWAGAAYKTISFYQSKEISPRFDRIPATQTFPFSGFKNLEQLSPHTAEENFNILRRLKEKFPEKVIVASIMGQNENEWRQLSRMAEEAGADMIECNFSCPQMAKQGLGSDIGQDPELIALYTQATCHGSRLPVIAKMTPNTGNMEIPAMAAVSHGAHALAAINTIKSITRIDSETYSSFPDIEGRSSVGGYSGQAIKPIALRFIKDMASYKPLKDIPLFGIGGITTWRDALDFILLGCSAVQICTSVMEYGFRIIDPLKEGLSLYMQRHGFGSIEEMRGIALEHIVPPEQLNRDRNLRARIDSGRCIACGRCYLSCSDGGHQAILWKGRHPEIDQTCCVGCGLCTLVCPTQACRLDI